MYFTWRDATLVPHWALKGAQVGITPFTFLMPFRLTYQLKDLLKRNQLSLFGQFHVPLEMRLSKGINLRLAEKAFLSRIQLRRKEKASKESM